MKKVKAKPKTEKSIDLDEILPEYDFTKARPNKFASHKYEIILSWSNEDQAFIADVPELPGCSAHGATQEAALASAQEAIQLWIESAHEFGDPIPQPKGRSLIFA